jgi:hypothetical protein
MKLDPHVNVFAIPLKSRPRKPSKTSKKAKARQAVFEKLKQPALLTDRIQPLRRPTLSLK